MWTFYKNNILVEKPSWLEDEEMATKWTQSPMKYSTFVQGNCRSSISLCPHYDATIIFSEGSMVPKSVSIDMGVRNDNEVTSILRIELSNQELEAKLKEKLLKDISAQGIRDFIFREVANSDALDKAHFYAKIMGQNVVVSDSILLDLQITRGHIYNRLMDGLQSGNLRKEGIVTSATVTLVGQAGIPMEMEVQNYLSASLKTNPSIAQFAVEPELKMEMEVEMKSLLTPDLVIGGTEMTLEATASTPIHAKIVREGATAGHLEVSIPEDWEAKAKLSLEPLLETAEKNTLPSDGSATMVPLFLGLTSEKSLMKVNDELENSEEYSWALKKTSLKIGYVLSLGESSKQLRLYADLPESSIQRFEIELGAVSEYAKKLQGTAKVIVGSKVYLDWTLTDVYEPQKENLSGHLKSALHEPIMLKGKSTVHQSLAFYITFNC